MSHPAKSLGPCPICGREMIEGPSVNEHHWVPKSQGGTEVAVLHKVCHRLIHEVIDEKEMASAYANAEALRAHPDVARFIAWVRKKPADFIDWPKSPRANKGRRKRPPVVIPTGRQTPRSS